MIEMATTKAKNFFQFSCSVFRECKATFKSGGMKAVIRRYGWKVFAAFFVYYLVRDLTIYVLLPYLVAKRFF